MGTFLVIEPGMLTTVQDLGRTGLGAMGIPVGGAADTLSLRAGNRLLGNADNAAGLEMTLTGAAIEFEADAFVTLTGGASGATLARPGAAAKAISPLQPVPVAAGSRLIVGPILGSARGYLCVRGGINVAQVLNSASTHLGAEFGGFGGRALRAGDRLEFHDTPGHPLDRRIAPGAGELLNVSSAQRTIAAIDGANQSLFDRAAVELFWSSTFKVLSQSNRVGVRLQGPPVASPSDGQLISEGMPPGAIQVPQSGEPIVLGVDHPTTGGYPVIACVITADLCILGRARPGDTVSFRRVSLDEARAMHRRQEQRFTELFGTP
ncbi:MAG: biotin-dependent carboxyltransferase family protein [Planctomycetota bacterium]